MNFIVSAATDVGLVKQVNQDCYSVRGFRTDLGEMIFAILCDGMGGLTHGEVASATLVEAFNQWATTRLSVLCQQGISDQAIREEWVQLIRSCGDDLRQYGAQNGFSLGTTVTALLLTGTRYYLVNVGDTRAYEITDQVNQLTRDQTVVAQEVEQGRLTEEQAETDPRRSILLQCVGASEAVYPDLFFGDTRPDAVYLLCSDGFRHELTREELLQALHPHNMTDADTMQHTLEQLIELNKQRQERDNISAVAIRTF